MDDEDDEGVRAAIHVLDRILGKPMPPTQPAGVDGGLLELRLQAFAERIRAKHGNGENAPGAATGSRSLRLERLTDDPTAGPPGGNAEAITPREARRASGAWGVPLPPAERRVEVRFWFP
jgi:hypothetical protein